MENIENQEKISNNSFVILGKGTDKEQKLNIINCLQANYTNNRLVNVLELEDNSFIIDVENPKSSGRSISNPMRLSRESFMALFNTIMMFNTMRGADYLEELTTALANTEGVKYSFFGDLEKFDTDNAIIKFDESLKAKTNKTE